ncbi:MAG TPA: quinolinate synthase NadA [Gammaproteobacteria bacterium]|nr:quinolinate synthase NadA [Gammaproteobacteria bacterium]
MATSAIAFQAFKPADDELLQTRVREAKAKLGDRLLILGHHYQREDVIQHADCTGDSLKLSRIAAKSDADYIVFCGVHFMAEVADILTRPEQVSILPDLAAGCSMADMASLGKVEKAWRELDQVLGDAEQRITPMTYINSAADLKAFCGRHNGIVCTSTNARQVLEWGFTQTEKILFFPDQHLGRNTAFAMGIPLDEMVVWDFDLPMGGLTEDAIKNAKMILWKGFCSVHQVFKTAHIDSFLAEYPEGKIISHPEASFEVCQKSHYVGSTEYIIDTIAQAKPNTQWLVGTELNLVNRLANRYKPENKLVKFMAPSISMCSTMFRINASQLANTLDNLVEGKIVNQIKVTEDEAQQALLALQRMFEVSP